MCRFVHSQNIEIVPAGAFADDGKDAIYPVLKVLLPMNLFSNSRTKINER